MPLTFSFDSPQAAALETSGGKGANLARLAQAGFPVPPGFIVSTQAYCDFVTANRLDGAVQSALPSGDLDPEQLESASTQIRALFAGGQMPEALRHSLLDAYHRLGSGPVAVRSSATAEDLPEMSFAGQQDTYLNILGDDALVQAVVSCWASLWTARAIGYRTRNRVPQDDISLAVVVQAMVESQVSGVLFTANPLTGQRAQTVIDAAFGLGEALVSGKVEPDHYVVDAASGQILEKTLGAKLLSIHSKAGGGTQHVEQPRKQQQALADEQVRALAQLGRRVAELYGESQDIEWAWAGEQLYLLQSRPVTSLYPALQGLPTDPLQVTFSFGSVQGMLDPMTPIGRSAIKLIFAAAADLFAIRVDENTQTVLYDAGERLWVNITPIARSTIGRTVLHYAFEMVDPAVLQALQPLLEDPRLQPGRPGIRPRRVLQLAGFFLPVAGNVLLNLLAPDMRRLYIVAHGERIIERMRAGLGAIRGPAPDLTPTPLPQEGENQTRPLSLSFSQEAGAMQGPRRRMAQAVVLFRQTLRNHLGGLFVLFVSGVASGVASMNILRMMMKDLPDEPGSPSWGDTLLELTRAVPNNPTTEMDLRLWEMARSVQADPQLLAEFSADDAPTLARRFRTGEMSPAGQALVADFLERYGGRGLAEIDLGRERWSEDPAHVFDVLSGYLQITQPEQFPEAVYARGDASARAALDRLCAALARTRGGWLKVRRARFLAGRMRRLLGLRESPKFFAVRLMALLRAPLLDAGAELARAGELEYPDDVFYLSCSEIEAFAAGEPRDWRGIIAGRRAANRREGARRQVPRLLLSDGRAFYKGITDLTAADGQIVGSPVSPGSVEGLVRVVLDPRHAGLRPGDILVCPGTDPSWTPLFLSAAGLIMEVGGMMTHGAVVAREYGIPAIVGVDLATTRLQTGQRIRMDGSMGVIELIDAGE